MLFYAAKIIWFLVQPSSLFAICLILAAVLSGTRWSWPARRLLIGGTVAYTVCGLAPVSDALLLPLENRFVRPDLDRGDPIKGVIILGGVLDPKFDPLRELAGLTGTAERITEAVALARRFPQSRVVFTGGRWALFRNGLPESFAIGRLLEAMGVAKERIELESSSRNTYENALYTKRLLNPGAHERWLLITSAWHMPRAMGCFRKVGFPVEAWPVDYRTPSLREIGFDESIPRGLRQTDIAAKEYVGLVTYYLAGRTDALLPGPEF